MYNGVGLQTARGSGTSGYVQRNLSALRYRDEKGNTEPRDSRRDRNDLPNRQPDKSILDHDRKRKVEVRCMELRDELEEQGVAADEIEDRVEQLRATLLDALDNPASSFGNATHAQTRALRPSDVHALSAAKQAESEKWKAALGVRGDYQEGQGFSAEYHQRMREERRAASKAEYERREEARAARRRAAEEADAERQRQRERNSWRPGNDRDDEAERREFEEELRARRRERERSYDEERQEKGKQKERAEDDREGSERGARAGQRRDDSADGDSDRSRSLSPPPRRRRDDSRSLSPPPRRRS
ncbi:RNA-splicing factor [Tilletia horrida]|nr:RNA-splicing factor [Tilletia horrida]